MRDTKKQPVDAIFRKAFKQFSPTRFFAVMVTLHVILSK